ncbi:MAG: hypothetical protein EP329_14615 [Deltaproteobacteria bacterium]|nr:MAG: hypothetical protein EP329_14615 [Deltaproteobacteria bacterium]
MWPSAGYRDDMRLFAALQLVLAALAVTACADVGDPWYVERPVTVVPDGPISWAEDVQPILRAHACDVCHSGARAKAGLDVSTVDTFYASGVIAACDSAQSVLIDYVSSDPCAMPPVDAPGGQVCLGEAEIEILRRWIDEGAEANFDPATCAATTR